MKKILLLQIFTCSILIINAQTTAALKIENGVSQQLADHRKDILDSVEYRLSFIVPPDKTSSIKAGMFISFVLKKDATPLQIDFKQDAERIKTISVNFNKVKIHVKNEHILINQSDLNAGRN